MTNAEKIRKMSEKELSKFLFMFEENPCSFCAEIGCEQTNDSACSRGYENWLKQRHTEGKKPKEIIEMLVQLSSHADISCIVASNGELFVYSSEDVSGDTMLRLAREVKNGTKIHITK